MYTDCVMACPFSLSTCKKEVSLGNRNQLWNYHLIAIFIVLSTLSSSGQRSFRAPLWFPGDSLHIVGLSLELTARDDAKDCVISGFNFEFFGSGIILPLAPFPVIRQNKSYVDSMIRQVPSLRIHGISLSPLGLAAGVKVNGLFLNGIGSYATVVNGLQVAVITNAAQSVNGLQLSAFGNEVGYFNGLQLSAIGNVSTVSSRGVQVAIINKAADHRGVQFGILNRSDKLKGLQIGLWNRNGKRALPFFNW